MTDETTTPVEAAVTAETTTEQPATPEPEHWIAHIERILHEDTAAAARVLMRIVHELEAEVAELKAKLGG